MSLPTTSIVTALLLILKGKLLEYLMQLLSLSLSEVLTHCSGHVLLLIFCDHGNSDEEVEVYGGEKKKTYCRVQKSHKLKAATTVAVQASSSR